MYTVQIVFNEPIDTGKDVMPELPRLNG